MHRCIDKRILIGVPPLVSPPSVPTKRCWSRQYSLFCLASKSTRTKQRNGPATNDTTATFRGSARINRQLIAIVDTRNGHRTRDGWRGGLRCRKRLCLRSRPADFKPSPCRSPEIARRATDAQAASQRELIPYRIAKIKASDPIGGNRGDRLRPGSGSARYLCSRDDTGGPSGGCCLVIEAMPSPLPSTIYIRELRRGGRFLPASSPSAGKAVCPICSLCRRPRLRRYVRSLEQPHGFADHVAALRVDPFPCDFRRIGAGQSPHQRWPCRRVQQAHPKRGASSDVLKSYPFLRASMHARRW